MSNSRRSDNHTPLNVEELGARRRREYRKMEGVLKRSQSQGIQPIQILEQHEKSLSEAHAEDKKHIQRLEKELLNCSQEIDYLQDQLSARNVDMNYLEEHVRCLELKLEGMEDLQEEVFSLREELKRSNSKQFSLIQELNTKEIELEKSALSIEKLEESFSSIALESQFEVESMKLDMMALEQSLFEAKKIQDETLDENNRMSRSIEELQVALQDAQKIIISLNEENRELKEKLDNANKNSRISSHKDEYWLENKDRSQLKTQSSFSEQGNNSVTEDISTYEVHGPHVGRLPMILDPASDLKGKMEMSQLIQEYECLIKKLKEELREEKLRAKEEAEDLVQEMAELRYQFTSLLEEECKRRACVEQASLQRIVELEARLQREHKNP
ncbi:intracellular protein transport protein USO isoform X1 [Spatholobus suberectus]|nr:intracellular protein transport protein USO isoform X1 [Spatholobus suberectus]